MPRKRAWTDPGHGPRDRASGSQRPPPEPTVSDTLENSVCSTRPPTAGCSSMERQSIDRARNEELCWSWSLLWAMWCMVLTDTCRVGAAGGVPVPASPRARARRLSECVSSGSDGTVQGERYCSARGEILRSLQDARQRRRSARTCSSIKDESLGSEDDQTPS